MRRSLLAAAGLFLMWELYATVRWIGESGGLGAAFRSFWNALTADRMLQLVMTDHLLIAGLVLGLMILDAFRRAWPAGRIALLAAGFVALGSPVLLVYLAGRGRATR